MVNEMDLYIENLHSEIQELDLKVLFSTYGEVKKIKIMRNHTSEACAFMKIEKTPIEIDLIKELNGKSFLGKKISLRKLIHKKG